MRLADKPIRLDVAMVQRGLASSRSQARDLILRSAVTVKGVPVRAPGMRVAPGDAVAVAAGAACWVSRGAVKLMAALDKFAFDATGRVALDIGASTGGFTQALLARGAFRVYAVDVGRAQLHPAVAVDPRVVQREELDARSLTAAQVPEPVEAIVADVSFISLTKALPAALALAAPGCWLVALVKPQFEAGRAAVGKGGVVRDATDRVRALESVRGWISAQPGWHVVGAITSPIAGRAGNEEFLLGAVRDG
jgi:23S rRNA (cytidine1920-2'-O)/16S rRNA (cytidine1409-2'-O)-methyltransferase